MSVEDRFGVQEAPQIEDPFEYLWDRSPKDSVVLVHTPTLRIELEKQYRTDGQPKQVIVKVYDGPVETPREAYVVGRLGLVSWGAKAPSHTGLSMNENSRPGVEIDWRNARVVATYVRDRIAA